MNRTRSISEVISEKKPAIRIKDYTKVHSIYKMYWDMHYLEMSRNIRKYDSFMFFRDLAIYLQENYKNPLFKKFVYEDMAQLFLLQI